MLHRLEDFKNSPYISVTSCVWCYFDRSTFLGRSTFCDNFGFAGYCTWFLKQKCLTENLRTWGWQWGSGHLYPLNILKLFFFIGKKLNCVTQRVCAGSSSSNMFDTALMLTCKYRTVQFFTTLHGYLFLYQCEIRITISRFYEKIEVQSKI